MRRITNFALIVSICMAFTVSSPHLFAQCGSAANGSIIYCCGQAVFTNQEFNPNGGGNLGQVLVPCGYAGVPSCGLSFVLASGSCYAASIRNPEVRSQLDQISQQMPLLVASCTGGFESYQPQHDEAPDDKKFILRSPKLKLTRSGE